MFLPTVSCKTVGQLVVLDKYLMQGPVSSWGMNTISSAEHTFPLQPKMVKSEILWHFSFISDHLQLALKSRLFLMICLQYLFSFFCLRANCSGNHYLHSFSRFGFLKKVLLYTFLIIFTF